MSERSILAFQGYREGSQKFDYFITALTGAMFAYIVQSYHPQRLDLGAAAIEPLALLILAISFFLGLKRIEASVLSMRLNHELLDAAEKAGSATEALSKGVTQGYNVLSGEIVTHQDLQLQREKQLKRKEAASAAVRLVGDRAERYYRYRNLLLVAGFLTILLARILQPYS